jgi:hypothetical protein
MKHLIEIFKAFLGVDLNDVQAMAGETMRNLLSLGLKYTIIGNNHEEYLNLLGLNFLNT